MKWQNQQGLVGETLMWIDIKNENAVYELKTTVFMQSTVSAIEIEKSTQLIFINVYKYKSIHAFSAVVEYNRGVSGVR